MYGLSLFSGIGGLDLGMERAGITVVGQVEIDPFCRAVLRRHWPTVPHHDDVRTAVDWWHSEPRPVVDVVFGGFPCQPFSLASRRRRGVRDERWGWPWMRDVIDSIGPRYVVTENVVSLLGDTEAFGVLLTDLSDLGFAVEWSCVSACSVGAPHTRNRLFVLAHPKGERLEGRQTHTAWDDKRDQPAGQNLSGRWPAVCESETRGVAHGFPDRVDRTRSLGNAVVPAVAELVGRMIMITNAGNMA